MILLVKKTKHGSGIELGDNLSKHISLHNTESKSLFIKDLIDNLHNIKNQNIIFIKYLDIDDSILYKIKNNNNKIFYMAVDKYPEKKIDFLFDGIIFSNNQQKLDFNQYFNCKMSYVYYHHYSPSYSFLLPKIKDIGYFVAPENISEKIRQIPYINIYTNFNEYKNFMSEYKFHIEYREPESKHFLYKPCTKLSTAAFCESVFICSKDCSYSELLPKDYPYFLTNINKEIIDNIKDEYKNDKYFYALNSILKLKKELDINITSKKLLEFILQS